MKGAIVESAKTINSPMISSKNKIGASHHFLVSFMKVKSSLMNVMIFVI